MQLSLAMLEYPPRCSLLSSVIDQICWTSNFFLKTFNPPPYSFEGKSFFFASQKPIKKSGRWWFFCEKTGLHQFLMRLNHYSNLIQGFSLYIGVNLITRVKQPSNTLHFVRRILVLVQARNHIGRTSPLLHGRLKLPFDVVIILLPSNKLQNTTGF